MKRGFWVFHTGEEPIEEIVEYDVVQKCDSATVKVEPDCPESENMREFSFDLGGLHWNDYHADFYNSSQPHDDDAPVEEGEDEQEEMEEMEEYGHRLGLDEMLGDPFESCEMSEESFESERESGDDLPCFLQGIDKLLDDDE